MSEVDPWEKAAECANAIRSTTDPQLRTMLTSLRDLWIGLANESQFLSADALAREAESIGRLHAELSASERRTIH
jgi:hypothetical protein